MYWSSKAWARPASGGPKTVVDQAVVDGPELVAGARKETRDAAESLRDGRCARRGQAKRPALFRDAVIAFGVGPSALGRPQRVGQMLLHQRDLGLHRELDVGERWRAPRA